MARQRAGETDVVTRERVRFWEPTSGSTGGTPKHVPYTDSLRGAFSRSFAAWAHDVLAHGPALRHGTIWFSVTPRFHATVAGGDGAPVGTADDRDYLEGPLRALLAPFVRIPLGLAGERDPEGWRRRLARYLCAQRDIEVFSVWSPTMLTVLLDWMVAHREELPNSGLVGDWPALWPALRVVSCWDAGSAAGPAARLRDEFGPGVLVQGKGLLATEAPLTIPRVGFPDAGVPLVHEVVIELLSEAGDLLPVERAEPGQTYEIVLSQTAGLARYRLGDIVEARGRAHATPGLRFVGRAGAVDLVGEKLTEGAVLAALAAAGAPAGCCLFARGDHYVLEVDAPVLPEGLAARVEAALGSGHHYRLARDLGQLGPVRAVAAPGRAARELDDAPQWGAVKGRVLRG
jgi:hypothetical protein